MSESKPRAVRGDSRRLLGEEESLPPLELPPNLHLPPDARAYILKAAADLGIAPPPPVNLHAFLRLFLNQRILPQ